MSHPTDAYSELLSHLQSTALLGSCSAVLGWDEQTYLPSGGSEHRANQLAMLAGITHQRATHPRIAELLAQLEAQTDLHSDALVNVREARRRYSRLTKLPQSLVEELSRTTTLAQQAWVGARKQKSFALFAPWLSKVLKLKREEAAAVGFGSGVPYDAMLDEYEPGATSASINAIFAPLRRELVNLVSAIVDSGRKLPAEILARRYPIHSQTGFATQAARAIGFDFEKGRLDVAAHPFCSGIGPGDCRLTTRYDEYHFPGAFFGVLHEAGHGIYEQGLDPTAFGTGLGETVSLGIHESQSRLWENFVGRSLPFWQHFFPIAKATFAEALGDVDVNGFYSAINDVRPSFIRVEADEVTYNLHIMLRFEIEQALLSGDLNTPDVPTAWNESFQKYFGLTPTDDSLGCLQDIHWSAGLLGYFPTYALGNMYAAQLFEAADRDLGGLSAQFARGDFMPLKNWLNQKVHRQGKRFSAADLIQHVSGSPLSHAPLLRHLKTRFEPLYGLHS